jgi:Copper transport outer membrane protein, MctB
MFDLRYHVASLAAVFVALVIGILVGVALASHGLGNAERSTLQNKAAEKQRQLDELTARYTELVNSSRANEAFVETVYPAIVKDRLRRHRIAVLYLGSANGKVVQAIDQTLRDSGAPPVVRLRAVTVPVRFPGVERTLERRPQLAAFAGTDQVGELGRELGHELVSGGETMLWSALERQLVEQRAGGKAPADGVIVVRTAGPQQRSTARFLSGLYAGLAETGVPVVGVEASDAEISAVKAYHRGGMSSVDDVDKPEGRLALALLLSGTGSGDYGVKPTAKGKILPEPVQPVTAQPGG